MYYYILYVLGRLRRQYFMQIPESDEDYGNSRTWFAVDTAATMSLMALVGGALLSALLKNVGVNDSVNGIISSIPTLACVFQFFGMMVSKRLKKHKLFVSSLAIVQKLFYSFLYFIPFINMRTDFKIALFVVCITMAFGVGNLITPSAGDWLASLIPQEIRGRYLGRRDMVAVLAMSVVTVSAGWIIDFFGGFDRTALGFQIVGLIGILLSVISFVSLSAVKEPKLTNVINGGFEAHGSLVRKKLCVEKGCEEGARKLFLEAIKDKKIKKVIVVLMIWQSAFFLSSPYFGIYQISELGLSYTYITLVGLVANLIRISITPLWSRMADKKSWAKTIKCGYAVFGVAFLQNAFTNPYNGAGMFVIYSVLSSIGLGALVMGHFALLLDYAKRERRTAFIGVSWAVMGLMGFVSSFIGGYILSIFQKNEIYLGAFRIYGQQILSLISALVIVVLVLYMHRVVEKLEIERVESDGRQAVKI